MKSKPVLSGPSCTNQPDLADLWKMYAFCKRLSGSHTIDIKVRKDGVDRWYEGDWIKYIPQHLMVASLHWAVQTPPTRWQLFGRCIWWYLSLMPLRGYLAWRKRHG